MKLIGVLGGTSWPSTLLLYRRFNELVQDRLGHPHSARLLLYSIDYHAIKSRYHHGWDEIPALLKREAEELLSRRPDCWMIANNTLHRAYDRIAGELSAHVPFFHAVRLTRARLVELGTKRVLLLGTKFTMEDGFFAKPLREAGLEVVVPEPGERDRIQAMQTRLASGEMNDEFPRYFSGLLDRYHRTGCEGVITACTELPLVIDQSRTPLLMMDPLDLQARACTDFAQT
ncbi:MULTISPECIES: aspartate/glutamate racemase family protein [unclassified Erythrobacter]|uniref:aspartate/glutamate racemase family protein n=1 Tax=unclassified Erythrobacter TaxID=2633097 RepID=UPI0007B942CE|nr:MULTISPECIES: amino acid racemase [unclassified Erythrobacter]